MAQKIINTKIREAYDTEANWIKHNPVLLAGQLAFSSDKYGKYKVGNGTSTWSQYVTLNWGDIGGKPSSFAPTTHNHTISQITDIGNASVKYATTAGSANTTSQIIDPSDKHGINISYVDEVNTTSWIPVYKDRNHMSTISTNNLRNAIGAAQASHSHNNYLPLSGGIVPNLNAILADIKTNDNITPMVASIATSPFARFYWHDHFAFLNSHTIVNHQVMLNGQSSWVDNNLNLTSLFMQKEHVDCTILEKSQLARRFTIKCNSFSYCAIEWIEMGVAYSDPFSKFEVLLEQSTDNVKWTTIHQSLMTDKNAFLRAEIGGQCTYLRFTFTKKTNVTTGSVRLTCIKGLTYRKGDQGLGIEYETPFDWDAYRNIYPHRNMSANLGTGSNKWKSVYAETFYGNLSGHATSANMLNANAGSSTQPVYFTGGKPVACTYTLGKSVPSNAVFTDTNTWRPIQDNLTSTSTTDSLSANQGRILKGLVDGKAPLTHTHNTVNDFKDSSAIGISSSTVVTPTQAIDYDIVVTNTSNYGNKLVAMTKVSLINQISDQVISNIPLKAITNSQIDSLANL